MNMNEKLKSPDFLLPKLGDLLGGDIINGDPEIDAPGSGGAIFQSIRRDDVLFSLPDGTEITVNKDGSIK